MKPIKSDQIEIKTLAGRTNDNEPIIYIKTYGGLHTYYVQKGDEFAAVGASPLKSVSQFLADKALFKDNKIVEWFEEEKELAKSKPISQSDRIKAIIFSPVVAKGESLNKADANFLLKDHPPEMKAKLHPFARWLEEKVPHTQAQQWLLHHHTVNPEAIASNMPKIEHYGWLLQNHAPARTIPFSKKLSFEDGMRQLENHDNNYIQSQANAPKVNRLVAPKGKKILDLGKGWGWHNLGTDSCPDEAKAMGHCGTESGAVIHSLRREDASGKHEPHITAAIHEGGYVTQIKGRANSKPTSKFHAPIKALLLSPHVSHIVRSGYRPDLDFNINDLSPEDKAEVLAAKPHVDPEHSLTPTAALASFPESLHEQSPEFVEKIEGYSMLEQKFGKDWHTPEMLMQGLKDGNEYIRKAAVSHANATPEMLMMGMNDGHPDVRHAAVSHANATPEILMQGLKDGHKYVRQAAVSHANATPEMLMMGMNVEHPDVRQAAIQHPNATPEMLMMGVNDKDPVVRQAAVRHTNATPEMLMMGMRDGSELVREAAVRHANATPEMLMQGLKDGHKYVRQAAVRHTNATPEMLMMGMNDKDPVVRQAAVRHTNATPEMLMMGINDNKDEDSWRVRHAAIQHPNATPEMLMMGMNDKDPDVRHAAQEAIDKRTAEGTWQEPEERLAASEKLYAVYDTQNRNAFITSELDELNPLFIVRNINNLQIPAMTIGTYLTKQEESDNIYIYDRTRETNTSSSPQEVGSVHRTDRLPRRDVGGVSAGRICDVSREDNRRDEPKPLSMLDVGREFIRQLHKSGGRIIDSTLPENCRKGGEEIVLEVLAKYIPHKVGLVDGNRVSIYHPYGKLASRDGRQAPIVWVYNQMEAKKRDESNKNLLPKFLAKIPEVSRPAFQKLYDTTMQDRGRHISVGHNIHRNHGGEQIIRSNHLHHIMNESNTTKRDVFSNGSMWLQVNRHSNEDKPCTDHWVLESSGNVKHVGTTDTHQFIPTKEVADSYNEMLRGRKK